MSRNLGTLTSWNPLGHSRPVTGLLYLYLYWTYWRYYTTMAMYCDLYKYDENDKSYKEQNIWLLILFPTFKFMLPAASQVPQSTQLKRQTFLHTYTHKQKGWVSIPHGDRGSTVVKVLCYKSEGRWCSIPDGVIGFFRWHNLPDRTMALGSTQPLTEMSTRSNPWG
jgi:hypothetical protein